MILHTLGVQAEPFKKKLAVYSKNSEHSVYARLSSWFCFGIRGAVILQLSGFYCSVYHTIIILYHTLLYSRKGPASLVVASQELPRDSSSGQAPWHAKEGGRQERPEAENTRHF